MVWRSGRARNLLNSNSTGGQLITDYALSSSEHESSEGEFVEPEKPWPPVDLDRTSRSRTRAAVAPLHVPRPQSHLFRKSDGRARGSKHSRRWENSMFLRSLHQIPEEELEDSNIVPEHSSPLTQLHSSDKCMQIWCSFTARSEEEQERIVSLSGRQAPSPIATAVIDNDRTNLPLESEDRLLSEQAELPGEEMPEQRFRKVDRRIRSVLQHNKRLPLESLFNLEEELRFFFSIDHGGVVLALQTNPFYRLLLHGVCQYTGLQSTTEQYAGSSIMVVECKTNQFSPPSTTLSDFLKYRK